MCPLPGAGRVCKKVIVNVARVPVRSQPLDGHMLLSVANVFVKNGGLLGPLLTPVAVMKLAAGPVTDIEVE